MHEQNSPSQSFEMWTFSSLQLRTTHPRWLAQAAALIFTHSDLIRNGSLVRSPVSGWVFRTDSILHALNRQGPGSSHLFSVVCTVTVRWGRCTKLLNWLLGTFPLFLSTDGVGRSQRNSLEWWHCLRCYSRVNTLGDAQFDLMLKQHMCSPYKSTVCLQFYHAFLMVILCI